MEAYGNSKSTAKDKIFADKLSGARYYMTQSLFHNYVSSSVENITNEEVLVLTIFTVKLLRGFFDSSFQWFRLRNHKVP